MQVNPLIHLNISTLLCNQTNLYNQNSCIILELNPHISHNQTLKSMIIQSNKGPSSNHQIIKLQKKCRNGGWFPCQHWLQSHQADVILQVQQSQEEPDEGPEDVPDPCPGLCLVLDSLHDHGYLVSNNILGGLIQA